MTGPLDKITPANIESRGASSKQTQSTLKTNVTNWISTFPRMLPDKLSRILLITQIPMYVVLGLAGFQSYTNFYLSETVLTTMVGIAAASAFPYSISFAVTVIRKPSDAED